MRSSLRRRGEDVLVAQDELGGVVGLHGHAEFGHLDRAGVLP